MLLLLLHEVKNTQLKYLVALSLYQAMVAARGEVFTKVLTYVSVCYTQQNAVICQSEISLKPTLFIPPSNTGLVTFVLNILT